MKRLFIPLVIIALSFSACKKKCYTCTVPPLPAGFGGTSYPAYPAQQYQICPDNPQYSSVGKGGNKISAGDTTATCTL